MGDWALCELSVASLKLRHKHGNSANLCVSGLKSTSLCCPQTPKTSAGAREETLEAAALKQKGREGGLSLQSSG